MLPENISALEGDWCIVILETYITWRSQPNRGTVSELSLRTEEGQKKFSDESWFGGEV